MSRSDEDQASKSEARLNDYLKELRDDPPESDPDLSGRVVRRARWQRAARGPLQAIGLLFAALTDGLADFLGTNHRSRR